MKPNIQIKKYKFKNFTSLTKSEAKKVLDWRNNKKIRKWMDNKKIISFKVHQTFIKKLKIKKNSLYFLVSKNKKNLAVFNINEIKNKRGKIGYLISPNLKNQIISFEIIYHCLLLCFNKLNLDRIYGYSLKTNKGANFLNKQFQINLKKYKNKCYGYLNKKKWKKNVEKNQKILNYLKLLK